MGKYLRVNLLVLEPRLMKKKNLPGRGLTKVEKHCFEGHRHNGAITLQKPHDVAQRFCNVNWAYWLRKGYNNGRRKDLCLRQVI